ncbi:MAG: hypothetical protein MPN21_26610 [Thermoanaerobaculia bacterium]|nr:hypothetical protein [Thermoanaerobaculia bacterium]
MSRSPTSETTRDVIVVGSGPAGTFAAKGLLGLDTLMLDVGRRPSQPLSPDASLRELIRQGSADPTQILGPRFESLHNISHRYLSPKLKAPQLRFVTDSPNESGFIGSNGHEAVTSSARGGLANAWGGGAYRFNDSELASFPVSSRDLKPLYDEVSKAIGISGADDDASAYFGPATDCLPAVELSAIGQDLIDVYGRRRAWFRGNGVTIGRPRLAVLTRRYQGRSPYRYNGAEFFRPLVPGIYNPTTTLDRLVDEGLDYRSSRQVQSYREVDGVVEVTCKNTASGASERYRARRLVLAAGTLSTSRIVLASRRDNRTQLPILDNLVSFSADAQAEQTRLPTAS